MNESSNSTQRLSYLKLFLPVNSDRHFDNMGDGAKYHNAKVYVRYSLCWKLNQHNFERRKVFGRLKL